MKKYRIKQFVKNGRVWYKLQQRVFLLFWSERLNNSIYTTYMTTCLKSAEIELQLLEEV